MNMQGFAPKGAFFMAVTAAIMIWSAGSQAQETTISSTPIYGSQLMSDPERSAYQAKIRALKTDRERDAFRLEHHELMQIRAASRGITLPMDPPGSGMQGRLPPGAGPGLAPGNAGAGSSGGVGGGSGSVNGGGRK
jgi:hypothetical protein